VFPGGSEILPLFPSPISIDRGWEGLGMMDGMDGIERGFLSVVVLSFLVLVGGVVAMALS